jgi:RNA polymerase sigma-70 factor (ECF subfamily)
MDTKTKIFQEVYDHESDAIFRFALIKVSSRDQALDITQDTFMRLWKCMTEKKNISNYKSFLFTICRNLIIDWYRKKKSISLNAMSENYDNFDVIDNSSINNLEINFEAKNILEKIGELNETYQTPLYLKFVEGLSPKEISEIIDISENAVSVRINRGIEVLRDKMKYK